MGQPNITTAEQYGLGAGSATGMAWEVKKLSREGATKAAKVKVIVTDAAANTQESLQEMPFANLLNYQGFHTPWSCQAFAKLVPKGWGRIMLDIEMCSFCLSHRVDDDCYGKG
jgi:hypothetical protein